MANGKRGAPLGNTNGSKAKRWAQAIDKALKRYHRAAQEATEDDAALEAVKAGEALDHIAHKVVQAALEGDWWAVTEIGNRLDGKAAQAIDISGELTHVSQLSDAQIIERLERIRIAAGAPEPLSGEEDAAGVH